MPYAARARQEAVIPTSAVGLVVDPQQAEEIVASGRADAVMLGRQLLREPHWAHRAAAELGVRPTWPDQYGYAVRSRGESG